MSSTLPHTLRAASDLSGVVAGAPGHDHMVGIYEDADDLIRGVADLLEPGFEQDDSAIVVATELHRRGIETLLRRRGHDLAALERDGRLFVLDAAELLASFQGPSGPDPTPFREHVGGALDRAGADGRHVRVFGEMVTLLWEEGDVTGALVLEDLWNELLVGRPASLLCGYPADAFANERSTDAFRAVCERHTEVVTSTTPRADERTRSRTVALLEHERVVDKNLLADLAAQQRALEDALSHLREATARRDELLAIVVHDIRSPATMITNALALILQAGQDLDWDETRELLETAHEAGERIARLSRDIVTSAELDAGSFTFDLRPLDLTRVVADAVQETRAATGRVIEFRHDPDLPAALADEVRQRQVLGNLLGNAVKFSPADTTITVTLTGADDRLEVRVRDAGPGIAPSDQARLFRPFTRLDGTRNVEGNGLGLHSARLLTEGQGGAIWVESELGHGAVFAYTVLTLPGGDAGA